MLGEYREIPGEAKLLIYLSFIPSLAIGFIYTDLAFFLTTVQGLGASFSGLIIGIMAITTVAASIPFGIMADRYGRRRFVIIGNVLASITLAAFALTTQPLLLAGAAVVEGSTEAAFAAAGAALLTEKAGDRKRTAAFSLQSFLGNMAYGLGGFAIPAVLVFQAFGMSGREAHEALYVTLSLLSLAVTPLLLKIGESKRSTKVKSLREFIPRKSKAVMVRYAVTSGLIAAGAGLFVPLMSQWFAFAYQVPDTVSGPVLGVSGFLIAATTLAAPWLARRLGVVKASVATQGLSTVFMLAVPFSPTFAIAAVVYIVRAFVMNVSNPLVTSMVMGLVTDDERGAAAGLSQAIWRFPNSITAYFGGLLMQEGYLKQPFIVATALYATAIALFWGFFRKARLPEETGVAVATAS